jgi:hypothetical protein
MFLRWVVLQSVVATVRVAAGLAYRSRLHGASLAMVPLFLVVLAGASGVRGPARLAPRCRVAGRRRSPSPVVRGGTLPAPGLLGRARGSRRWSTRADFLSCLLVVFAAVAVTARPPQVKTYGAYAVTLSWPAGNNDVDLYVRDPAGAICYFRDTQVDQMQLEHDDLGKMATSYGRGRKHVERTALRRTMPGQYVVNTLLFSRATGTAPIAVSAELWSLQGDDRMLKARTVYLAHAGDERTPFRFTVDSSGATTGFSYVRVSLLQPTKTFSVSP